MDWNQKHIKKINVIGVDPSGKEVIHLETKGGHHRIVVKTHSGHYKILGYGSSRGHAKNMADKTAGKIHWREDLYKSEEKQTAKEFSPEDYVAQASWYVHCMERAVNVSEKLHHAFKAIHFLRASRLSQDKIQETMTTLKKHEMDKPPFDENMLIAYYELNFENDFYSGFDL